jgi:hypothetical protein
MNRFGFIILLCLLASLSYAGPFAHFLNPITKQANRIDFGTKTFQVLIDKKHWVDAGAITIDSLSFSEIRKESEFRSIATNTPNEFILFLECTNQLFKLNLTSKTIKRLDQTYFRGDNCGAFTFFRKGKYYQVGGYGFWETNNHISYFDSQIKEWEGVAVSGDVPTGVYRGYTAYLPEKDKLITLSNFSNDISHTFGTLDLINDIFEFSFATRTWKNLGQITHPYLKDVLSKLPVDSRIRVLYTGKYFVVFPLGSKGHVTITFIDPRDLSIYEYEDINMEFSRFPFFSMTVEKPNIFFHNEWVLGTKYSNDIHLVNESKLVNFHDIAKKAKFLGYLTDKPWYQKNWFYAAILLSIFFVLYRIARKLFGQRIQTKQPDIIPPNTTQGASHFDKLQVDLLINFYHQSTPEGLNVDQVNEILGINQLGADTQRFRRSQVIKDLNSKLALLTGEKNAILRVSSQLDKRQKRYQLHDNVKDFVKNELSL